MMDTASPWMGNCKWHTSSFRIIIIWSTDVWKTREGWRSWGSTHFQISTSVDLTISYCWHNCTITVLFTQHNPLFYYREPFISKYCCTVACQIFEPHSLTAAWDKHQTERWVQWKRNWYTETQIADTAYNLFYKQKRFPVSCYECYAVLTNQHYMETQWQKPEFHSSHSSV